MRAIPELALIDREIEALLGEGPKEPEGIVPTDGTIDQIADNLSRAEQRQEYKSSASKTFRRTVD